MNLFASEAATRRGNIDYLYKTLAGSLGLAGGNAEVLSEKDRCVFSATVPDDAERFFRPSLEDKITDLIAINYKYEYFKRYVRSSGLKPIEYELLLSALIAADLEEDKRFALSKLLPPYTVDGSFVFKMKPLKRKWAEIVGYVPEYFVGSQLKDFVGYIVNERKGKKVYVYSGNVFDARYNKLCRSDLLGDGDCAVTKEIILSLSGEVVLDCKVSDEDEYYLKEFFGDKIFFGKGYFS